MRRSLLLGGGLMVIWILLWGELSVGNVATGLLLIPAVLLVARTRRTAPGHRLRPLRLLGLAGYLLLALVRATFQVAVAVVVPTDSRLRAGIVACPLQTDSRLVATVVSDLITLTPGTLVVEVTEAPLVLYVHVLGLTDPATVRADVADLERRVTAALTPIVAAGART